jgi:hypothetical protein
MIRSLAIAAISVLAPLKVPGWRETPSLERKIRFTGQIRSLANIDIEQRGWHVTVYAMRSGHPDGSNGQWTQHYRIDGPVMFVLGPDRIEAVGEVGPQWMMADGR